MEESVFEVNMLVINTELVFCSNYNKGVFDYLKKIGMTHRYVYLVEKMGWSHIEVNMLSVPFRHRWLLG